MGFDCKKTPAQLTSEESFIFHRISNESCWTNIPVNRVVASEDLDNFVKEKLHSIFHKSVEFIDRKNKFYRARIVRAPYEFYVESDMGPPPVEKTPRGRVQPEGVPVLYAAAKRSIALFEVRPEIGAKVAIAECRLKDDRILKILDIGLRGISLSSIINEKEESIDFEEMGRLIKAVRFSMKHFAKPVDEADIDKYRETIYISQKIQEMGYDGVSYLSSLLPDYGKNYAFFCPSHFEFKIINHRIIKKIFVANEFVGNINDG